MVTGMNLEDISLGLDIWQREFDLAINATGTNQGGI